MRIFYRLFSINKIPNRISMEYIPIKTRVVLPPRDDLFAVMDESLNDFASGDILVVTSKVVSIHYGRCIPIKSSPDKSELIRQEAHSAPVRHTVAGHEFSLTITHNTLLPSAGIDESNSNGYYTLLPEDPFAAAREIFSYLRERFSVQNGGVIISDSHSLPLRYGVVGVALGWWGLSPLRDYTGTNDLFGRRLHFARSNIVDAVSAGAVLAMGEGAEMQPLCIVRGVEGVTFTDTDTRAELYIPPHDDLYAPLLRVFGNRIGGK